MPLHFFYSLICCVKWWTDEDSRIICLVLTPFKVWKSCGPELWTLSRSGTGIAFFGRIQNNEIDETKARGSSENVSHSQPAQTSFTAGHRCKRQSLFPLFCLAQSLTSSSRVLSFQPGKQNVCSCDFSLLNDGVIIGLNAAVLRHAVLSR